MDPTILAPQRGDGRNTCIADRLALALFSKPYGVSGAELQVSSRDCEPVCFGSPYRFALVAVLRVLLLRENIRDLYPSWSLQGCSQASQTRLPEIFRAGWNCQFYSPYGLADDVSPGKVQC